jgi:hypothetical protein
MARHPEARSAERIAVHPRLSLSIQGCCPAEAPAWREGRNRELHADVADQCGWGG